MNNYKREEAACYRTARNVTTFCCGFCFAALIIALIHHDWNGLVVSAGILAILIGTKVVFLNGR